MAAFEDRVATQGVFRHQARRASLVEEAAAADAGATWRSNWQSENVRGAFLYQAQLETVSGGISKRGFWPAERVLELCFAKARQGKQLCLAACLEFNKSAAALQAVQNLMLRFLAGCEPRAPAAGILPATLNCARRERSGLAQRVARAGPQKFVDHNDGCAKRFAQLMTERGHGLQSREKPESNASRSPASLHQRLCPPPLLRSFASKPDGLFWLQSENQDAQPRRMGIQNGAPRASTFVPSAARRTAVCSLAKASRGFAKAQTRLFADQLTCRFLKFLLAQLFCWRCPVRVML